MLLHVRLLVAAMVTVASLAAEQFTGKVVGVSDGDTLKVMRAGTAVRVRLHGIDTPERKQPFATRARLFTSELAFGRTVTVVVRDMDRYRRLVAEITLPDGRNLNRELIRAGLAWWFKRYAPGDRKLEELESEARLARRGLWEDANPVAPWEWRAAAKAVTAQ